MPCGRIYLMPGLPPANDKLREAEFFFFMMEHHFHTYGFKYFVSAFLSGPFKRDRT
jgi:hypothetical protein